MKKILIVILLFSLIGNGWMAWKLYNQKQLSKDDFTFYSNSVKSITNAESYVNQSFNATGTNKIAQLFNTYNEINNARLFITKYEKLFQNTGIDVGNLVVLLDDESFTLMGEISNELNGKEVNQQKLLFIERDLKYLSQNLPPSYDKKKLDQMKNFFNQIAHQY